MKEDLADGVTMYLGDCRDVLPTLAHAQVGVTDPPYGVKLRNKKNDFRGSRFFDNSKSLLASVLYRDDDAHVRALIRQTIPVFLGKVDRAIVFSGPAMLWEYPEPTAMGSVFTPNGAGRSPWGFQCTHPILFYGKDPFLQDGMGSRPNSLRDEQPNREKIDHPCPKPAAWLRWAVNRASRYGETVLDPFAGSGTTGVACVQLGRRFVGIEIVPEYFDIACRRISEALSRPDLFINKPSPYERAAELFDAVV